LPPFALIHMEAMVNSCWATLNSAACYDFTSATLGSFVIILWASLFSQRNPCTHFAYLAIRVGRYLCGIDFQASL
jgi:hypothetical protein